MSSTNKTTNYKLSQFIGTDKPTFLGDYNNDMEIIDGALFSASQTAEQAVNDVESVKGAQAELKNVHTETQEQVAQLKETADGMTGDVTAAQEAANSAEQKATEAQTAATGVLNAANAASANATKAKQTADGNKTTLAELTQRVEALEGVPKSEPLKLGECRVTPQNGTGGTLLDLTVGNFKTMTLTIFKDNYNEVLVKGDSTPLGSITGRGAQTKTLSDISISGYSKITITYTGDSTGSTLGYRDVTFSL